MDERNLQVLLRDIVYRVQIVLPRWRSRIVLGCLVAFLLSVFLVIVGWASTRILAAFGRAIETVVSLSGDRAEWRGGPLTADLFRDLLDARIIEFDPERLRFGIPVDCGAEAIGLGRAAAKGSEAPADMVARLCNTDLGITIRTELEAWNQRARMVAVRDNRGVDATPSSSLAADLPRTSCDKGRATAGLILPAGCQGNRWSGFVQDQAGDRGDFTVVHDLDPPPLEVYGFLALREQIRGFGEWRRFEPALVDTSKIVMRTHLNHQEGGRRPRKLVIDVIGDDVHATARMAGGNGPVLAPIQQVTLCDHSLSSSTCQRMVADGRMEPTTAERRRWSRMGRADRITFQLESDIDYEITVTAAPVRAVAGRVADLAETRFILPSGAAQTASDPDRQVRLSAHVVASCRDWSATAPLEEDDDDDDEGGQSAETALPADKSKKITACVASWKPGAPSEPLALGPRPEAAPPMAAPGRWVIKTSGPAPVSLSEEMPKVDGAAKSSESGAKAREKAAKATLDLGLLPIVGIDDRDRGGLLARLRRMPPSGAAAPFALSIDERLQAAANEALSGIMLGRGPFGDLRRRLLPGRDEERRGGIVLLDAGPLGEGGFDPPTGRILAVASWPHLRPGLSEWDLTALENYRPLRNPLAARAWSQNDRFYAPGSTFKLVVSLAGIDRAARGNDTVAAYLGADAAHPGLDGPGLQRQIGEEFGFGYRTPSLTVPLFRGGVPAGEKKITSEGNSLCSNVQPRGACAKGGGHVRLADMLAASNNIYFARLALLLDADAVSRKEASGRVEDYAKTEPGRLALAAMAARLWPADEIDLLPKTRSDGWSRLKVTPIQVDETAYNRDRLLRVALNGIGQAAQATPLAMASVAATIAGGRIVSPRLEAEGAPPADRPLFEAGKGLDAQQADAMLRSLRQGMAAVVQHEDGTAHAAFAGNPELMRRISGKTGTAEIANDPARSDRDGNTVWFVGWLDGLKVPGYEQRRIAFACMLTHAPNEHAFGGTISAPLIRRLFERIERAAQPAASGEAVP